MASCFLGHIGPTSLPITLAFPLGMARVALNACTHSSRPRHLNSPVCLLSAVPDSQVNFFESWGSESFIFVFPTLSGTWTQKVLYKCGC